MLQSLKKVTEHPCRLAENPIWSERHGGFFWTDILAGKLWFWDHRAEPIVVYEGPPVGGFTIQADGKLLLFRERGNIVVYCPVEKAVAALHERIDLIARDFGRFNDVIACPDGSVLCGSLAGNNPGYLFRLRIDGDIELVYSGVGLSNGLAFSPDLKLVYYVDSAKKKIYRAKYSADELGERREFYSHPGLGCPDGLTVDVFGNIYVAIWEEGKLLHLAHDGKLTGEIQFPAARLTSVCFGTQALDRLLVTSAMSSEDIDAECFGGHVFFADIGCRGRPEFLSQVGIH
jgi:D-xylono/L-arabinono-1,4-lactonase